jgi:uncharacterized lipoprotein YddW (UPF0748 family)
MKKTLLTSLFVITIALCNAAEPYFRATWISTVANIDFPTKEAIGNYEQQKADMIAMLDAFQAMHLNAVIFQVRPTADALYKSELEPWSAWLTGKQGEAASYDPLEFVCAEAHKRGIDVHVWINPYRVTIPAMNIEDLAPDHMYHKHPEWFLKYGKQWYYAPHLQETRDFLCQVVADLVTRYDIQAIHMDDYFYPYPNPGEDFPDYASFAQYGRGYSNKADWRRDNVNVLIKEIHETVRDCKPWVKFGVSPFGIYRNKKSDPNGSETNGLQNYDDLYADVLMWVNNGWVDYNIPQIYWEIGHKAADYETLIHWWAKHASARPLFIGQDVLRTVKNVDLKNPSQHQLPAKMKLQRSLSSVGGSCQWYAAAVVDNPGNYCTLLEQNYHRHPALIPTSPFMDDKAPGKVKKVKMVWTFQGPVLFWTAPKAKDEMDKAVQYVVYRFGAKEKIDLNDPSHIVGITRDTFFNLPYEDGKVKYQYVVTALDRLHNESQPVKKKVKL